MAVTLPVIPLAICLLLSNLAVAFKITGAGGSHNATTGVRPYRLDINDFSQSGPPFDLYIQALSRLQARDQSDPLSYFQIAGIHGYPRSPWDGVSGTNPYSPGFCVHGSTPFPTWHRPYLALMEQILWTEAQAIARTYPSGLQDVYNTAAWTLRLPFWDWAVHPALPAVVQDATIIINTPAGRTAVQNPLYKYSFQWDAGGNGFPRDQVKLADLPFTVRHWNSETRQSNQTAASAEMLANAGQIVASTYQLFTDVTDYVSFSCFTPNGRLNSGNNVENIHGNIHNIVGGNGHMLYPEISAFDPIFWLHHANVDRLLAMWQILNPASYFTPTVNVYGTYYELPGSIDSGNSSLAPFHSDNGTTMFTNDAVRNIRLFNYAYPDIPDWSLNGTSLASYVRTQINLKYNPPGLAQRRLKRSSRRATSVTAAFSNISPQEIRNLGFNNADVQWTIKIVLERYAYSTAFSLDFFMGDPPEDVASWSTAPELVGSHSQFIPFNVPAMFPNGAPRGLSQGEVSLTHVLSAGVSRGFLRDLSPAIVLPVLRDALTWRARTPDNCEVNLADLAGLSIAVASKRTWPTTVKDRFPSYGQLEWHHEATAGKIGGDSCGISNE
ncbi:uncharacterized protein HMPREF1541_08381 [Cyphellophora europaea CBS 101466]|uniref:tyrosinase n=1 Tax=Cyphellophora europaea (strain CBS 101466) TaxID=1220924 RepID=W2RM76_CYPE1|nr:uncharacterized protein HMPREF1541_08381 [Cyphellophora europaea CBS 101466]ETN37390.1 hypothetical protein HMPREF1541_08381 [Cyphellophora europaea CBS 101466]